MIQKQTLLDVVDNTGGKTVMCIDMYGGYRNRYGYFGDPLLASIKSIRQKRRDSVKVNKGQVHRGVIVKTKKEINLFSGDNFSYLERPSVVLLSKQNKILGTRIFGSLYKGFRYTKYLKILSLSSGIHSS